MVKIEKILCPIDFSEFSEKAFAYAHSFATQYKAKLYLQHAILPLTEDYVFPTWREQYYAEAKKEAEEEVEKLMDRRAVAGFKPELLTQVGFAADSILAEAAKRTIDLIVMGTHGRHGLDRLTVGSTAEKVLRKSQCPVLVVRKPAHDFVRPGRNEDTVQLRSILFATDFSDFAHHALAYALSFAMEYHAELTLMHVLEDVPRDQELQSEMDRVIHDLELPLPADARDWYTVKSTVRVGKPYQEIIQFATESQTDLIVLGVRGRSILDMAVFGSTTYRVIQLGPSPVLAVPM